MSKHVIVIVGIPGHQAGLVKYVVLINTLHPIPGQRTFSVERAL